MGPGPELGRGALGFPGAPRFAVGMTIAAKPHCYIQQMAHSPDPRPTWLGWGLFYSLWHLRKGVQENWVTCPRSLHW